MDKIINSDPREPEYYGENPVGSGISTSKGQSSETGFGILPLGFHTEQKAYRDIYVFEKRLQQLMVANQRKLRMGEFVLFSLCLTMCVTLIGILAPLAESEYKGGTATHFSVNGKSTPSAFRYWVDAILSHLYSLFVLLLQIPLFLSYIFSFNHLFSPFAVFIFCFVSLLSFVATRSYFHLIVLPSRWHQGLNRTLRHFNMELNSQGLLLFTTRIPPDFFKGYEKYRQTKQTEEVYQFLEDYSNRLSLFQRLKNILTPPQQPKRRATKSKRSGTLQTSPSISDAETAASVSHSRSSSALSSTNSSSSSVTNQSLESRSSQRLLKKDLNKIKKAQ